jgi:hypothetical protein
VWVDIIFALNKEKNEMFLFDLFIGQDGWKYLSVYDLKNYTHTQHKICCSGQIEEIIGGLITGGERILVVRPVGIGLNLVDVLDKMGVLYETIREI